MKNKLKEYEITLLKKQCFSQPVKILTIEFFDNFSKKIEDLKEYIYEMINYSYCPCTFNFCTNQVSEFGVQSSNQLRFQNYNDDCLLSNTYLNEKFYVAIEGICRGYLCKYTNFKKYYHMSKTGIINDFNESNNKLESNITAKENEISNLKNELKDYKNLQDKYEENLKIIKEKETQLLDLSKKFQNKEYQYKNLYNSEQDKINQINKLKIDIKGLNEKVSNLNSQIIRINKESSEKDDIIKNGKAEHENNKKNLTSLKEEIKIKNQEIDKLSKLNEEAQRKINDLTKKVKELNSILEEKNNKINELNINNKMQKDNSNKLKNELNDNLELIKNIEIEKENYKKNLNEAISEKQKIEKNNLIIEENEKKLNSKLNEMEKLKENQNNIIQKLKEDKSFLTLAINKDLGTLKQFHELGFLSNITVNNSCIQIDPKTNQFIFNNNNINNYKNNEFEEIDFKDFYDVIINIKSIKDIEKGWEIKMTENGEKNFKKYRNKELIKIGVIGNSNKGKSFILSRLSKITLPSGTSIRTEGLSIKYPELKEFKDRKIILLDSAGLETPVLNNDNNVEDEVDIEEEEKENEEILNKENFENMKENVNNNENSENKNGNDTEEKLNNAIFKEKSREKLITELFLQNYIINNSDILIIVVGILTYSEQKSLNRIKTDLQKLKIKNNLFIIHNLKTFVTKKQVEDYIKTCLKKSATFQIKKGAKISSNIQSKNGVLYYEKNSEQNIYHLIFANEGSEAGDYYNNFTLQFIENAYQNITNKKPFDVIQTIKERFISLSTEIIEKNNENQNMFKIEDLVDNEEIIKNKIIKFRTPQKITLKRCLIDELGFSNLRGNGFEPNYNYFKNNNKIIIRVEAPGNSIISSKLEYSGECTFIRLSGVKKLDKEPKNKSDNIVTTREFGEFNLDIPLKTEDYNVKNEKPKICDKKGIIILEYECEGKIEKYDYAGKEEDEV